MTRQLTTGSLPAVVVFYLAVAAASAPVHAPRWHLVLHVAGAVALIATVTVMGIVMTVMGRSARRDVRRRGIDLVNVADVWVTGPAVVAVLANGLTLAVRRWGGWGALVERSWITLGLVAFAVTGIIWLAILVPEQIRMSRLVRDPTSPRDAFERALARWTRFGLAATALPWFAYYVMAVKPQLW